MFASDKFRLVRADEKGYPAFYRVIWNDHVREFSDLAPADRVECIEAVVAVERVLREHLQPAKVNIASLGNMVAHLHWHVIARFEGDPAWPASAWSAPQREGDAQRNAAIEGTRTNLEEALRSALQMPPADGRGNCTAS